MLQNKPKKIPTQTKSLCCPAGKLYVALFIFWRNKVGRPGVKYVLITSLHLCRNGRNCRNRMGSQVGHKDMPFVRCSQAHTARNRIHSATRSPPPATASGEQSQLVRSRDSVYGGNSITATFRKEGEEIRWSSVVGRSRAEDSSRTHCLRRNLDTQNKKCIVGCNSNPVRSRPDRHLRVVHGAQCERCDAV